MSDSVSLRFLIFVLGVWEGFGGWEDDDNLEGKGGLERGAGGGCGVWGMCGMGGWGLGVDWVEGRGGVGRNVGRNVGKEEWGKVEREREREEIVSKT